MLEEILPGLSHAPNVHPMFVHFPIALWAAAALFWVLGSLRKRDDLFAIGRWLLYLGTASAVVAIATGLWAASEMGHSSAGHDLVHVHRNFMFVTTALALVATGAAFFLRNRTGARCRWGLTMVLLVTVVVMTLGADRGAALVFRYGMGIADEAPAPGDELHQDDPHQHSH